ncbi:ribonuclease H-like domain-containing protein, partial [Flagelloscypha sp. PMI_526]
IVAISCVSVGTGRGGRKPMVFRVAITDLWGEVLLNTYVFPQKPVTHYRTEQTGITPHHLSSSSCMSFQAVQDKVIGLIDGKIIVGHCIWLDLSVLDISYPARYTCDVALYQPFRNALNTPLIPGLSALAWTFLQCQCCTGAKNPLEYCRVTLDIWYYQWQAWEEAVHDFNWPCQLPPSQYFHYFT